MASTALVLSLGTNAASVALAHDSKPNQHRKVRPPRVMLKFATNYGVDGPFRGFEIGGIPGDANPWRSTASSACCSRTAP